MSEEKNVMRETLCWSCTAPGTRRCSWDDSKGRVPVEGWTAVETSIRADNGKCRERSYRVIACPLYEQGR